MDRTIHRKAKHYRWEGVDELPYKEDDRALFKSITRQVLFSDPEMHGELRYFEVAPGGFSTLERHEHMHAVLILASVPRHRRRAARLSLHGERRARQAAIADARGSGEARAGCRDRGILAQ
jgi:hypothetical protein